MALNLGTSRAPEARLESHAQHTHHVHGHSANAPEVSATGAERSYGTVALAAGLCGFALSLVSGKPRSRRAQHQRCRVVNVRDEAAVSLAASQALASVSAAGGEVLEQTKDLDSVETAMADFVPRIAALQTQAQLLRSGELSEVINAMQDLSKPELQNVFMEVDQVLCALVDAIQNLKKSAIEIRREEIDEQMKSLEDGDQEWVTDIEERSIGLTAGQDEIDTMMEVHVVGLSHHSAPVEIRERLSVAQAEWNQYAQDLVKFTQTSNGHVVPEVAVLSTCNRFEIYFSSKELAQYSAIQCVNAFLRHKSGLSREELEPYLFTHTGSEAVHHLFEVSSGLDSLVLGEAQILSQVKACHEHCIAKPDPNDESVVQGSGGKILSRLLNAGIRMGKLARTRTRIGVGAVSVSSAAVELMMAKAVGDVRKDPENLNVCVVGAGKMSRLLLLALFSKYPDIKLTLVNRSVENAQALLDEEMVSQRGGCNATVAGCDEMMDVIRQSDVVFTASGYDKPFIAADDLQGMDRKLMLIDIAVPRNVDPSCDQVEGVHSYSVDDLKLIQDANNEARRSEVLKAKELIDEQAHNFKLWQHSQGAVPYLAALQVMAEKIRESSTERASKRLKDLDVKERQAVDKLGRNIIDQMLRPIYYSMKDEEHISIKKNKILGLKKIFDLEPLYKRNRDLLLNGDAPKKLTAVSA